MILTGIGKMMVELCSAEIVLRVCKYLSCKQGHIRDKVKGQMTPKKTYEVKIQTIADCRGELNHILSKDFIEK